MATVEQIATKLRLLFKRISLLQRDRDKGSDPDDPQGYKQLLDQEIQQREKDVVAQLEGLVRFPPHLDGIAQHLTKFHENDRPYERSVFIMTKFPDAEGDQAAAKELNRVIDAVANSITKCGFVPRIAKGPEYLPLLWNNVELHLLGCSRGVAIIENKYKDELNPNVAMEWGWMRAMNKPVLYLVEKGFNKFRADLSGLVDHRFSWDNPEHEIDGYVTGFLK